MRSPCACGSHDRIRIGEDVSERLDVVPAKFRVIVTRRPKYACKTCRDGVVQASAPARLIEAGLPTEALLAHVAVSKYADGLPLYRQGNIYRRDGVELGRNLMAGWMGRVGFHLEPLAARVLDHIRAGPRIFADETTLPTLDPGRGKTKSAWLWAYARDDRPFGGTDPPMVAYRFEDGRGGDHPARHLAGFTGILQVDGYTAYRRLADPARSEAPMTLAACWAHLRRKFYELARRRFIADRDMDRGAHGRTLAPRGRDPRTSRRGPPGRPSEDRRADRRRTVRALARRARHASPARRRSPRSIRYA